MTFHFKCACKNNRCGVCFFYDTRKTLRKSVREEGQRKRLKYHGKLIIADGVSDLVIYHALVLHWLYHYCYVILPAGLIR